MWFFPLPCEDAAIQPGSIAHLLRERFDAYRREVRASFFDTHFRAFNRQIMLVDVLDALYAGRTAFEDTARAVHDLAAGLRGGRGFWTALASAALPGPLKPRPMERVAFVATKADRVPQQSRANLQRLLEALAEPAATTLGAGPRHGVVPCCRRDQRHAGWHRGDRRAHSGRGGRPHPGRKPGAPVLCR